MSLRKSTIFLSDMIILNYGEGFGSCCALVVLRSIKTSSRGGVIIYEKLIITIFPSMRHPLINTSKEYFNQDVQFSTSRRQRRIHTYQAKTTNLAHQDASTHITPRRPRRIHTYHAKTANLAHQDASTHITPRRPT